MSLEDDVAEVQNVLANNIRRRVRRAGLSLGELARGSGTTEAQLHNILSGRSAPTLRTLVKIANGLQTSPHQLLAPMRARKK